MLTWRRLSQPGTENAAMRCVVDENGNFVFISPAVGWALGMDVAALIAKPSRPVLDIISAHDGKHHSLDSYDVESGFYEVALLRQERDPLILQARLDRIDGPLGKKYTVIWLDPDNRLKRQKNDDFGQTARDFATFVIDNQKKFEEKTAEPEIKPEIDCISKADDGELRYFLNLTSDLLGVYRRDGSFVRVNPSFNRVLGYSDAELKQFPFIDLIFPEDREAVQSVMQKMLGAPPALETRVDFESRARCKDGNVRWLKWVHKAAGEHVYIVGLDVTDIKQHEAELYRREEQLSEAQKIGSMGHWYWEVGRAEMEMSDQIYAIFGVEKFKFSPTVDNVNALLLKRDLGKIYRSFQRALVRKKDYELEFRLRRPKGGIRFIHCEGRCKVNPKTGQVEALFGIMQDITERTIHERALREAKEAAETAYASKTRFLANMSHELRTPLNAIIGFSEMIQRQLLGPVGNARYLEYIGGIRESGEHLLDMINDILDMSKIEIGKYELYLEEINVGKIIRLAVHMIEGRAHEAQVHLITEDLPDDIQTVADRRALMQILLNLLSNAVKFTNAGGSVEIKCQCELGGVAIVVSDTGIGIPKDKIGVVTMPFEQLASELTRKHEGSGLGLAITKDLIELHGGTLEIESEPGIGTSVTVLLPKKIPEHKHAKVNA
ncbi:MAG: PAS domain-containing protein [Alphaproteobacteria bacterium]|nr:PAS domain-containing protein [Alphaproteobacteria bacterium]